MVELSNDFLQIKIAKKGAELKSVRNIKNNVEYMWNGNPDFWAKTSPILFPIVGSLKDNCYYFENKKYELPRHGFARDKNFEFQKIDESKALFTLKFDEETLKTFPFYFELVIDYQLVENKLSVNYTVKNNGSEMMYFSIGAHPAFAVPINENLNFDDYKLEFEKQETLNLYKLNAEGLIIDKAFPLETDLKLSKSLFYGDALVFKNMQSNSIIINSKKSESFLKFEYKDFPFFGIWAAKDADFVCLEPWCGIADFENMSQNIEEKIGINTLNSKAVFYRSWSITCN